MLGNFNGVNFILISFMKKQLPQYRKKSAVLNIQQCLGEAVMHHSKICKGAISKQTKAVITIATLIWCPVKHYKFYLDVQYKNLQVLISFLVKGKTLKC